MITLRETAYGIFGAWRLAHFDTSGLTCFDTSINGFWKSFYAALIVLPAYALLRMLTMTANVASAPPAGPVRLVLVLAIAYVISWVAFPLLMTLIADVLDRRQRYIGFIVAYNWSSVIQVAIMLPAATLVAIADNAFAWTLYFIASVGVMVYGWFIARTALNVPHGTAAVLVLIDFLLSLVINGVTDTLTGRI